MNPGVSHPSFFIGWDVGGWNCDRNRRSRDAIVILDDTKAIVGNPWRGNLSKCIANSSETTDWLQALFGKCQAQCPETLPNVTMAIDAPLGFPDDFVNLITRRGFVEADPVAGRNRYLFRHTERHLFERGLRPLSPIKDMIGSQATKAMHVLKKFSLEAKCCGVWTTRDASFGVIETYPAACRNTKPVTDFLDGQTSLGHPDKDDARLCALIAWLFARQRKRLAPPDTKSVPVGEGWIWIPKATCEH